ncbi:MAG: alpha/beta hydrolase [Roseiflexaceae bacterium]|nr:alpha/beta hydrolase [Roseiflexaceae bacterium]
MISLTESTIRANGIDIHYWRTGQPGAPVLLCLHGLSDSGRCWQSFAADLGGGYDLVMPDARGHGSSGRPGHGYRAEDRVADALALLDALDIERAFVIGHSMGGDQAAMLAASAPTRVRAAVLEDPSFRHGEAALPASAAADWASGLLANQALGMEALLEKARRELPHWDARVLDAWAESKMQCSPLAFEWLREPRRPWQEYVAQISVPTLVITAEPERGAIVGAATEALLTQGRHIRVARIAGAGHCVRYEQPAAFVELVRAFLAAH